MCLWKDFNQLRKVESLSNESYSTGIACRNINGGELGFSLCVFFQLQHVGGQQRHRRYRGQTKTSLI
jgi:hypothetical protein